MYSSSFFQNSNFSQPTNQESQWQNTGNGHGHDQSQLYVVRRLQGIDDMDILSKITIIIQERALGNYILQTHNQGSVISQTEKTRGFLGQDTKTKSQTSKKTQEQNQIELE